jgi:hypothetical protein
MAVRQHWNNAAETVMGIHSGMARCSEVRLRPERSGDVDARAYRPGGMGQLAGTNTGNVRPSVAGSKSTRTGRPMRNSGLALAAVASYSNPGYHFVVLAHLHNLVPLIFLWDWAGRIPSARGRLAFRLSRYRFPLSASSLAAEV